MVARPINSPSLFLSPINYFGPIPPPMKSFLKQYDLSGKTVIPFNTNARDGVGTGSQTIKDHCPKSTVLEGLFTKSGIERD
jgi:hypothetical protein